MSYHSKQYHIVTHVTLQYQNMIQYYIIKHNVIFYDIKVLLYDT